LVDGPLPTRFDNVFPLLLGRRTRLFFEFDVVYDKPD
jgi:hypothetical protein